MTVATVRDCSVPLDMSEGLEFTGEFIVNARERVALVGPNGSGKSTLMLLLAGFLKPSRGLVEVFGSAPNIRSEAFRSQIGLLLQHPDDQLLAPTVFQDASLGLRALGWKNELIKSRTDQVLRQLGIDHLRERAPHHLSGGEKKMVALAGALVHEPKLLLLDEPFAGLDGYAIVAMVRTLAEYISRVQGSIIISSHDLEGIGAWADRVYVVSRGVFSEAFSIEQVLAERSKLSAESYGYPEIPAVYSRLLVERLGHVCYNAKEVIT